MRQITDYTEIELKALAFDQIQAIEQAKANLATINQELSKRSQQKQAKELN